MKDSINQNDVASYFTNVTFLQERFSDLVLVERQG